MNSYTKNIQADSKFSCSASPVFVIFLFVQYLTAPSTFCLWWHHEEKKSFWHEEFSTHMFEQWKSLKTDLAKRLWPLQDGFHIIFGVPAIPLEVAAPVAALLAEGDQSMQLGLEWWMVLVIPTFGNPFELSRLRLHTTKGHTWICNVELIQTEFIDVGQTLKNQTYRSISHESWARKNPESWGVGFLGMLGADMKRWVTCAKTILFQGVMLIAYNIQFEMGKSHVIYITNL